MALTGLAGGGGFLNNQQDVDTYFNNVQNIANNGAKVNTDYTSQINQGLSGNVGPAPVGQVPIASPTPTPQQPLGERINNFLGVQDSQPTSDEQYNTYLQNLLDAQASLNNYQANNSNQDYYSTPQSNNTYQAPQQQQSIPSNYTGFYQGTPYVGGTVQTSGGGFTPDGSYSAGYHGSGERIGGGGYVDIEDHGPWGTGKNNGPIVNGTMQTGGGGFTPDGSYSAGYHGSGDHPEITGESTPGLYQSGLFGPIIAPDLSNGLKVDKFLRYISDMGFDTSKVDKGSLEKQYNDAGGKFDGLSFIQSLINSDPNKAALIAQYAGNPMMPTTDVWNLLGGSGFSRLFSQGGQTGLPSRIGGSEFYQGGAGTPSNTQTVTNVKSLRDIPNAIQDQFSSNYIYPYLGYTTEDDLKKLI